MDCAEFFILKNHLKLIFQLEYQPIDKDWIHVQMLDEISIFLLTDQRDAIGVEDFNGFFQ